MPQLRTHPVFRSYYHSPIGSEINYAKRAFAFQRAFFNVKDAVFKQAMAIASAVYYPQIKTTLNLRFVSFTYRNYLTYLPQRFFRVEKISTLPSAALETKVLEDGFLRVGRRSEVITSARLFGCKSTRRTLMRRCITRPAKLKLHHRSIDGCT